MKAIQTFLTTISGHFLTLTIVSAIVFREVFRMEFWKDDFALLYNLQINEPFYYPYHQLVMLYKPIYLLSGTDPRGYFAAGFIVFMLSAFIFYAFLMQIFKRRSAAFLGALVYVTAPTGVDTIFMTMLYAAGYFIVSLFTLTVLFLHRFHITKNNLWFIASLVTAALSYELVSYRGVYLFFIVILFEALFFKKNSTHIKAMSIRLALSFITWIYFFYLRPAFFLPEQLKHPNPEGLIRQFTDIFDYQLFLHPVLTMVNVMLGGIPRLIYGNFYTKYMLLRLATGGAVISGIGYIFLNLWKTDRKLFRWFAFSCAYILITTLSFYPFSQREISVVHFRYMVTALPAYGLFIICIYLFLKDRIKKRKYRLIPAVFVLAVIVVNALSVMLFLREYNVRAPYTAQINRKFKEYVPELPENAYIYIEMTNDAAINYRFIDTHRGGHYDSRAYFAVLYNLKMDKVNNPLSDYDELLTIVLDDPDKLQSVFAFKYDEQGLHHTTDEIRARLSGELDSDAGGR